MGAEGLAVMGSRNQRRCRRDDRLASPHNAMSMPASRLRASAIGPPIPARLAGGQSWRSWAGQIVSLAGSVQASALMYLAGSGTPRGGQAAPGGTRGLLLRYAGPTARPGRRPVAVPAAPPARAARYAALAMVSALAPGSPAASRAGASR